MACTSCASDKAGTLNDPKWRRALWIALAINGGMFAIEIVAGITGGSKALQADALDFFGDAANYAISLGVAGMAIAWRARAAMLKGATLALLGLYVLLAAGWGALHGAVPHAEVMGVVGIAALIANAVVAVMLYRFRSGDANMRSVWICSRNDAIGNVAVVLAAGGVFGLNSAWPDLVVAALMAVLGLSGGFQIMRQARAELRYASTPAPSTYRQPLHGVR
ncbi:MULTISPECIES: cation transporter [unclassified Sphingomonas]|jgi:Co/Zn/Cd efflux system component|uniref:cation transporter n=1 Tax=unclassified Sphingomonas TaxID=196159 RepID=UPI000829EEDB|nr:MULTISPECIES: cation transporter [unclassified Sphingomonas]MBB3694900.1 Co/Zn/Cd efflux system component [Sphingomonas sp. BK580]